MIFYATSLDDDERFELLCEDLIDAMEDEDWEKAEKILKEALDYYPFSANLYDSFGELLENQQKSKEAKRYYLKALKLAHKDKEMKLMIPIYEEHVKRIKTKLSAKS